MIITIDGPSGSGKSTLAVKIAKYLNFMYLNTGYLYRGLAYVLKNFYNYDEKKMNNPDQGDIMAIFQSGKLVYSYQDGLAKIFWIDDITFHLKEAEISRYATLLGQHEIVREQIHKYEHILLDGKDSVAEGRACGSVVFPHAQVKFFLTAAQNVRATRLQKDQMKRGNLMIGQEALNQIIFRDKVDQERAVEPLVKPHDSIELDSTSKNPEELLQEALEHIRKFLK
jgi:cytidylate kinase